MWQSPLTALVLPMAGAAQPKNFIVKIRNYNTMAPTGQHDWWVILVNMEISVILGHEKTKIRNIIDYGKIDVFSVRINIHIKNKMMGHLI